MNSTLEEGKYVARDIYKAIHYYTFAADQNFADAQFKLGKIYKEGKYVERDINKAIHYYTIAANQYNCDAQCNLGCIYAEGKYVTRDINKAIHYFQLAASKNIPEANFNLGNIYSNGLYIERDMKKTIYYYKLAAKQNYVKAQYRLGLIYFAIDGHLKDIDKGVSYLILASKNGDREANSAHAFLLHEGKYIDRNIEEAVNYYKEASSFNNQYAKNNLGVIYMYGDKTIGKAIEYFTEAINQKNDYLSMYNLARIYMFDGRVKKDIEKSNKMLYMSSINFFPSRELLALSLLKQFDFGIIKIIAELNKLETMIEVSASIFHIVNEYKKRGKSFVEKKYESFRSKDYLYNILSDEVLSSDLQNTKKVKNPQQNSCMKNISSEFYNGFGLII